MQRQALAYFDRFDRNPNATKVNDKRVKLLLYITPSIYVISDTLNMMICTTYYNLAVKEYIILPKENTQRYTWQK